MKYDCPCCGYKTFLQKPTGDYYICPVCFWEDDGVYDLEEYSDCNKLTLAKAKQNYFRFKACSKDMVKHVREPLPDEIPTDY